MSFFRRYYSAFDAEAIASMSWHFCAISDADGAQNIFRQVRANQKAFGQL